MSYAIVLKGKEVPVEFSPDDKIKLVEELFLSPNQYGALDLIKKKEGHPNGEVLVENGVFSLMKSPGQEPYIVDCSVSYDEICKLTEVQELRARPIE